MKQHYQTLGLEEGASQEEIKAAYNSLSKELNPANNDNQEFFIEEYEKVQTAYKALSNTSILGIEKTVKGLKKTQPESNDKEPSIAGNTPGPKAKKAPLKENKPARKGTSIIQWIFIVLGGILFGSLFSFLMSVYYFNETIESFIKRDFKVLAEGITVSGSNYLISDVFGNFLIGFFIFLFVVILVKKIKKPKILLRWLNYISNRKKNISLIIIVIPILKVILHYIFTYPENTFGEHFETIFKEDLHLFFVSTIIVLYITWFFNDKIKAR